MKLFKRLFCVILVTTIIVSAHGAAAAQAADGDAAALPAVSSMGACVIDYETGIMLYGKNAEVPRVPASMTKLLVAYVILDAVKAGEISLSTETVISQEVSDLSYNWEYANVPLPAGRATTVGALLDVVLVCSACAAADALAEALCGSVSAFVDRMNAKVASLGLDAMFFDTFGVSADNNITPFEMVQLTRFLISDHPDILKITSKATVTFGDLVYNNSNKLLGEYDGMDGIKTGYTDAAGQCFTGTAVRDGRRIIAVTMGSTSQETRFGDVRTLLDHGFAIADDVISRQQATATARQSGASLIINDVQTPLDAYLIGGSHFFRLRDIALLLAGTEKQFDVRWDSEARVVSIITGLSYVYDESALSKKGESPVPCTRTTSKILVDGAECSMEVYTIGGNNYFMLRDLGELIGFAVDWDETSRTVIIDTIDS